jgi:hypothetical protein
MTLLKRLKCLFGFHPPLIEWEEVQQNELYIFEEEVRLRCPRCGLEKDFLESEVLR